MGLSDTLRNRIPGLVDVWRDIVEGMTHIASNSYARASDVQDARAQLAAIFGPVVLEPRDGVLYFSHPEWRDYFRQTRAHNTVEIDGQSQSASLGPFLWGRRARPSVIEWYDDRDQSTITAEHDGYSMLADPVIHRRTITLDIRNLRVDGG